MIDCTVEGIGSYLLEHNIKPSYPRIKVMQILLQRTHPTADEIYAQAVKEMPTLSKTTVYNALNLFMEKNIVHSIYIGETEAKYDIDTSIHGHFKCECCNKVYDFSVDLEEQFFPELQGFFIRERDVYFTGTCKACLDKSE